MRLPSIYETHFGKLLDAVRACPGAFSKGPLAACWPQFGAEYRPGADWLYVGQAPNGWGREEDGVWIREDFCPPAAKFREFSEEWDDGDNGPLDWVERANVEGKRIRATSFWACVRRLASETDDEWGAGWSRRVGWSNLLKVGYAEAGFGKQKTGSPSGALALAQQDACRGLLRLEVEHADPAAIVFLTGETRFEPFSGDFEETERQRGRTRETTIRRGQFRGRPAVVAPHPRRAAFLGLGVEALHDRICRLLGADPEGTRSRRKQ